MRTRVSVSWVKLNCPSTESERGNATHRLPRETWRSAVSPWYATWPDHTAQQTIHFPKPAVSTINGPQSLLPITPEKSTLHILPTSTLVSVCCQSLLPRIAPPSPTLPSGAVRVSSHFLHFSHSLSLSLFYLGFSLHTFCISSTFCRFLILSISLLTVLRSGFVRNSDRGMLGILRDGEPWERKCDSPLQPSTSATVLSAPPPETVTRRALLFCFCLSYFFRWLWLLVRFVNALM